MPNLNKVMLMGNLTRDPELRHTPNNTSVANLSVAMNRRWRNQQGEQQEETTFVDCEAWGRTAETINEYMRKGRPIFIEGRLKLDQWQDQNGNNRSKLKVVVDNFQFVDSRGAEPEGGGSAPGSESSRQGGEGRGGGGQVPEPRPAGPDAAHQPIQEEDIPF